MAPRLCRLVSLSTLLLPDDFSLWSVFLINWRLKTPHQPSAENAFTKLSDSQTLACSSRQNCKTFSCNANADVLGPSSYAPSQADVAIYNAVGSAPDSAAYPHSARWYKHIKSHTSEHPSLPGDASKSAAAYLPVASTSAAPAASTEKAAAPAAEDDDEIDLFGSDDEEVDEAAEKLKAERLAEYAAKKAGKTKPAAKVRAVRAFILLC